jgi:16S rRNA (guanine527-N7)-methyltransferase
VFHVEQLKKRILDWGRSKALVISEDQIEMLSGYADMIYEENKMNNMTGLKERGDILETLVLESLDAMSALGVPRGTRYIDVGTGAGIPGIPTAILFPESKCVLLEVNLKKAVFLQKAIQGLRLSNVEQIVERAETAARLRSLRESFDLAVCRAVGSIYLVAELLLPFVKVGGSAFIYTNKLVCELNEHEINHIRILGGQAENLSDVNSDKCNYGVILNKILHTGNKYPRRYAVIKREALRIDKVQE